ncbi:GOLPH3/VPS74 family protein [Teichococcus vastitatis]|uniref:GPP34 family phosphoprotein n=1 Tax=Teichococcus vastitatis TaxID=2307076 RepID=A0ABS9W0X8_9PROT|nr:GPP34 family phosphoprotein [Pseudoroseomonas vastitatis]MCI0752693.1 GPP34 family phosphoprotein [Pseudoroseomonas vastitatis]
MPLTLPEELLLLTLDDETGRLIDRAAPSGDYALVAAILAELQLQGRIQAGSDTVAVLDSSPTGDAAMDDVLARLGAGTEPQGTRWWIESLGGEADRLRDHYFDRLVERGILKLEEGRFLWFFAERRYPVISDKEEREVKARIMAVIFEDTPPVPHDVLLIGLTRAAGLLPLLLATGELERAQSRIDAVADSEPLNRGLTDAVRDIFTAVARTGPVM